MFVETYDFICDITNIIRTHSDIKSYFEKFHNTSTKRNVGNKYLQFMA